MNLISAKNAVKNIMTVIFRRVGFIQTPLDSQSYFSDAGFTTFTSSVDTSVVYVADDGNDANSGRTSALPKLTLSAGIALLRDGYPDWLLIKRGSVFNNQRLHNTAEGPNNWWKSGRSASERMLVGAYGTGARPIIRPPGAENALAIAYGTTVSNLAFTDFAITPYSYDGSSSKPAGITFYINTAAAPCSNILIENLLVSSFHTGIVVQGGVLASNEWFRNCAIRRCLIASCYETGPIAGPYSQGLYIQGVDGFLLEENYLLHNGWLSVAHASQFRHNIYLDQDTGALNYNISTVGNVMLGTDGGQLRSGGYILRNLISNVNGGMAVGYTPTPEASGTISVIADNCIWDGSGTSLTSPDDMCYGMRLSNLKNSTISGNIINITSAITTSSNDRRAFWFSQIPGFTSNIICSSTTINRNIFNNAGAIQMQGTASQYPGGIIYNDNDFRFEFNWANSFGDNWLGIINDSATQSSSKFTGSGNSFWKPVLAQSAWFLLNGSNQSYASFISGFGMTNCSATQVSYPDTSRNIPNYMASLGETASIDAYMDKCMQQDKGHYDTRYVPETVNQYLRGGFGR